MKQLAARYAGRGRIMKLDAMAHAEAAEAYGVNEAYGVKGLPTLIVFDGGAEVDRHAGALGYTALNALIAPQVSAPTTQSTAASSVR